MRYTLAVIVKALAQHAAVEYGLRYRSLLVQWGYTFKAIICLLLNREHKTYEDYPVTVAWIDGGSGWSEFGTQYWNERFCVGYGVFAGWWYEIKQDSNI